MRARYVQSGIRATSLYPDETIWWGWIYLISDPCHACVTRWKYPMGSDISGLEEFCECGLIWNFEHFNIFINDFVMSLLIVRHTYESIKISNNFMSWVLHFPFFPFWGIYNLIELDLQYAMFINSFKLISSLIVCHHTSKTPHRAYMHFQCCHMAPCMCWLSNSLLHRGELWHWHVDPWLTTAFAPTLGTTASPHKTLVVLTLAPHAHFCACAHAGAGAVC
jgi:hypothetical protein